ncbi:MAG: MerR family DNA-binding transcriptional regulator [Candidatus Paceibacterota bacterium]|jgi:DNA-binding transcriptional MerR regulator
MDILQTKLITIQKAAEILGVTPLTLRNWDNSGKFSAGRHPINNYRVYKVSDIEKLLIEIEVSRGMKKPTKKQVRKLMVQHLTD